LGVIGSGSFCTVFKVKSAESNDIYALKKCTTFLRTKEAMANAMNEVDIVKYLRGDSKQSEGINHVVQLHDHWLSARGQLHQLYTYYGHGTLSDVIDSNLRMNELQILQVLRQIAVGLRYVHSVGVIHLDVKPSNIFVAADWKLIIGDFGISFNVDPDHMHSDASPRKRKFRCSGDPIYIAPELMHFQANAENIDFKTDIFSLGIIMLELLLDSNMPSQGAIFQSLRQNGLDFSSLPPYQHEEKDPENTPSVDSWGSGLLRKSHTSTLSVDSDIIKELAVPQSVDSAIKSLIQSMLQKDVAKRLSAEEVISNIDDILRDEQHVLYFDQCPGLNQLKLPPVDVVAQIPAAKQGSVEVDSDDRRCSSSSPASVSCRGSQSDSCPATADKPNRSCLIGDAPDTFYHEGHLTLDDVLRRQSFAADSVRHSLLTLPSPSTEDQGLQMNLSTVFDSMDRGGCTPLSSKKKGKRRRDSLEITPFFDRKLPETPYFGRNSVRPSPVKLMLPFASMMSPLKPLTDEKEEEEVDAVDEGDEHKEKETEELDEGWDEEEEYDEYDDDEEDEENEDGDDGVDIFGIPTVSEFEGANKKKKGSKMAISFLKRCIDFGKW